MIKDMISPNSFSDATRLVLANAVYFKGSHLFAFLIPLPLKGTWKTTFDKHVTWKDAPFFTLDGKEVKADRMRLTDDQLYASFDSLKASAVRLPF